MLCSLAFISLFKQVLHKSFNILGAFSDFTGAINLFSSLLFSVTDENSESESDTEEKLKGENPNRRAT